MPTYDYRCERTGEMFELWQSFADDAITECPETHADETEPCGAPVKKVFSKVGISFKGDGFYKNDHGSSGKRTTDSSSSTDSGSSSSSSDSSSGSSSSDSSSSKGSSGDSGSSSSTNSSSD